MSLTPRLTHQLEQVAALAREVGRAVTAHYRHLIDIEGLPEERAWELALRLEERLMGPLFEEEDPPA